jgi:threonine dehydrogenase-like Zn-dependent dehydrogenase
MNEYRLDLARSVGAEITLNPLYDDLQSALLDWTHGRGLEAAFDCVGNEAVAQQALAAVQVRGTVVIVGVSHKLTVNPWEQLICREVTILGTRSFKLADYDEMIALVRRGLPVEQVITHRFPLTKAAAAFDRPRPRPRSIGFARASAERYC